MLAAKLDDVRLVHDDAFNSVRRRELRVRSMSRVNSGASYPSEASTVADQGRRSRDAGSEDDERKEELLAEACWHLVETITVHDLTPRELTDLWSRLMTATAQTTTESTAAGQVDVERLCGGRRRQLTDKGHGPLSAGAYQADATYDETKPAGDVQ
jgi:hypothetical protein